MVFLILLCSLITNFLCDTLRVTSPLSLRIPRTGSSAGIFCCVFFLAGDLGDA